MDNLEKLWSTVTDHFKKTSVEVTYKHWISTAVPISLAQDILYIEVPTETHKKYWEDNLSSDLMQIGYEVIRRPFEPKFIVKNSAEAEQFYQTEPTSVLKNTNTTTVPATTTTKKATGASSSNGTEHDSKLNPKYTFETFITGPGSQMAHAAALVVSEKPGTLYNPLFFYGGVGLGKTHLMQAIGNQFKKINPDAHVKYVTSETFTNDLILSLRNKSQDEFRNKYRSVDLLLVDDIQFFADKEATQEEFFHTFNELLMNSKQIVLTSDRQPKEIKALQERLVSRFVSGLPVDITPPDLETRIAILAKKAEAVGIEIENETLSYIAGQIDSNVRELEGALVRVQAYSVTKGEDISTNLAAEALKNYYPDGNDRVVTIFEIQQEVARYYNITVEDLKGKKRTKSIVGPRQLAMYLSRELTSNSLPKIGHEFGGKDHSTVIHAYEKINDAIKEQEDLAAVVKELTKKLS
ncbi:chromosomal replication initiator protein DnaA [Granulicatella balaenopterae]|uniref:Chromosomal replication initiator protein DnaA n=1 Tax=Granulicatella balaenopterae TaxID=137733 RepID=A0A1H9NC28_9LACT|nr:chromosomal replication initiator protein DnaA [Granulicatella balaenopterae]SER33307.1 chromosomal replication initiator protein DnaA [Granulicatella balaenopterae]